jgi:hypothetical protein
VIFSVKQASGSGEASFSPICRAAILSQVLGGDGEEAGDGGAGGSRFVAALWIVDQPVGRPQAV